MKHLTLLFAITLFVFTSCDKESSSVTEWEAESFTLEVTPIPIVNGISISPQFTTTGKNLDYTLELDNEELTWKVTGDYTLSSDFFNSNIPILIEEFSNIEKSGTYTMSDGSNNIQFDKSLYNIEINGVKWANNDGEEIAFVTAESSDRLEQDQVEMNIKVTDSMNGNVRIKSVWKRK